MKVVCDIETNALVNPATVDVVVCKDIDTDAVYVFREGDFKAFADFANGVDLWIGHNFIDYDHLWIRTLLGVHISEERVLDTLVLSQLLNQGRQGGHSLENWGKILKFPKIEFNNFAEYSPEMEVYCINDVHLNHKVYSTLMAIVERNKGKFDKAIDIEMKSRWIARDMHENGFQFNIEEARAMRTELEDKVATLLQALQAAFPPKSTLIREVTPKLTKHGTISKTGFQWYKGEDFTIFQEGSTFSLAEFEPFNPGSPKQIVERLWEAGWKPTAKTNSHIETEAVLRSRWSSKQEREEARVKLERFKVYGWKINEENLATLPDTAPEACGLLVEYILTAARVRTLTEWIACYNHDTGRIHGRFNPLGTRTHRCSHSSPNMGNIATKKSIKYNTPRLRDLALEYGARMRSMWIAAPDTYLVGTDMEGAHLRIFAHLINDKNFIEALVNGDKKLGTDPHSINKRILGDVCLDRDRAKTFVFSFLNGAASPKVSEIFACPLVVAKEALDTFVRAYPGLAKLKGETFPRDADRGYFEGVDGRLVMCDDAHLMMGMVLQNMESVLMKYANLMWREELVKLGIRFKQVNWVHDEWVTEVFGGREVAELVGRIQSASIERVGVLFGLRCPMAGEYKVGKNWLEVH